MEGVKWTEWAASVKIIWGVRRVVSLSLREGHPRLRELSRRERGPGAESLQPSQARRSAPRSRGNLGAVGITSF